MRTTETADTSQTDARPPGRLVRERPLLACGIIRYGASWTLDTEPGRLRPSPCAGPRPNADRPPWRVNSREAADGFRPVWTAICLYSRFSARPREVSSRSAKVDIFRTAGILSRRSHQDQMLRLAELDRSLKWSEERRRWFTPGPAGLRGGQILAANPRDRQVGSSLWIFTTTSSAWLTCWSVLVSELKTCRTVP